MGDSLRVQSTTSANKPVTGSMVQPVHCEGPVPCLSVLLQASAGQSQLIGVIQGNIPHKLQTLLAETP